jgi:hypothetical protein
MWECLETPPRLLFRWVGRCGCCGDVSSVASLSVTMLFGLIDWQLYVRSPNDVNRNPIVEGADEMAPMGEKRERGDSRKL